MNSHIPSRIQFYQNLGKLFYAFAAIDNEVRKEELKKLIQIVNTKWIIVKDFDKTASNAIINTFKWLYNDNEYNAELCYKSFLQYLDKNRSLFNENINSLIIKTATEITASFSGQNKSEVILLAKLSLELKKHNDET